MAKKSVPGDVPVMDTTKLSQGLTTVFQGYSMIFEALAGQAELLTRAVMDAAEKPVEADTKEAASKPAAKKTAAKKDEAVSEPAEEVSEDIPSEDAPPWEETEAAAQPGEKAETADKPPVTITYFS